MIVKDQEIDDIFKTEVIAYGGIELNKDEKCIMKMHLIYKVFKKIDPIDCETEIEKAMTKIRWAQIEEGRKEDNGRKEEGATEKQKK